MSLQLEQERVAASARQASRERAAVVRAEVNFERLRARARAPHRRLRAHARDARPRLPARGLQLAGARAARPVGRDNRRAQPRAAHDTSLKNTSTETDSPGRVSDD